MGRDCIDLRLLVLAQVRYEIVERRKCDTDLDINDVVDIHKPFKKTTVREIGGRANNSQCAPWGENLCRSDLKRRVVLPPRQHQLEPSALRGFAQLLDVFIVELGGFAKNEWQFSFG